MMNTLIQGNLALDLLGKDMLYVTEEMPCTRKRKYHGVYLTKNCVSFLDAVTLLSDMNAG